MNTINIYCIYNQFYYLLCVKLFINTICGTISYVFLLKSRVKFQSVELYFTIFRTITS